MPAQQPGRRCRRRRSSTPGRDRPARRVHRLARRRARPSRPRTQYSPAGADIAKGGELFRTNCAQCHNFTGKGGALTHGKFAPSLEGVDPKHIYEAMQTGPQNMPSFPDTTLSEQNKQDIIAYLNAVNGDDTASPGGLELGGLGPVSRGPVRLDLRPRRADRRRHLGRRSDRKGQEVMSSQDIPEENLPAEQGTRARQRSASRTSRTRSPTRGCRPTSTASRTSTSGPPSGPSAWWPCCSRCRCSPRSASSPRTWHPGRQVDLRLPDRPRQRAELRAGPDPGRRRCSPSAPARSTGPAR